jgi:hypothetical protein
LGVDHEPATPVDGVEVKMTQVDAVVPNDTAGWVLKAGQNPCERRLRRCGAGIDPDLFSRRDFNVKVPENRRHAGMFHCQIFTRHANAVDRRVRKRDRERSRFLILGKGEQEVQFGQPGKKIVDVPHPLDDLVEACEEAADDDLGRDQLSYGQLANR